MIEPCGLSHFRINSENTGMRRITTFRLTTDRIYDFVPIRLKDKDKVVPLEAYSGLEGE
jgi:hypothetical protein